MRPITRIILHCSASLAGVNLSGNDIKCMHTNPVSQGGRGWKNPGYHYVVELSGKVVQILPESCIANGVKGYNQESIHICYVGGLAPLNPPKGGGPNGSNNGSGGASHPPLGGTRGAVAANTMTPAQRAAIAQLLTDLHAKFPHATLHGHNEFAAKACPCFKVKDVFPEFAAWQGEK